MSKIAEVKMLWLRNASFFTDASRAGLKRERKVLGDPGMADVWTSELSTYKTMRK